MKGNTKVLLITLSLTAVLEFIGLTIWFTKGFSLIVLAFVLSGLLVTAVGAVIQITYLIKSFDRATKLITETAERLAEL